MPMPASRTQESPRSAHRSSCHETRHRSARKPPDLVRLVPEANNNKCRYFLALGPRRISRTSRYPRTPGRSGSPLSEALNRQFLARLDAGASKPSPPRDGCWQSRWSRGRRRRPGRLPACPRRDSRRQNAAPAISHKQFGAANLQQESELVGEGPALLPLSVGKLE